MSEDRKKNELIEIGKNLIKNQEVEEKDESTKVTRGRGGNANFPNSKKGLIKTQQDRELVKLLLGEVLDEYKQPKVRSDKELAQRISDYFEKCAVTGQIPTVEEMAMSTGYSQATVWDWENGRNKGFSSETSELIKKAKDFIKTFDAKLVIAGKMNFLAYCFRAKNYYGMVDKQEHVIIPSNPLGEGADPEVIKKRLTEGVADE